MRSSCKIRRKLFYGGVLPFMQLLDLVPLFGAKQERTLGVFVSSETFSLVEMEPLAEAGRFRVRQARTEAWRGTNPPWKNAEAFAETLARLCATYGFSGESIGLCLPRDLFFIYEREFPPMERKELEAAARWDIETNVPYGEGAYWFGFKNPVEGRLELAALPEANGRDFVDAMEAAGLGVSGLAMEPLQIPLQREGERMVFHGATLELPAAVLGEPWTPELSAALYAAFRLYDSSVGIEFLPQEEKAERARFWQTAGNFLLAGTFLLVSVLFARNLWLLSAADARLDRLRQVCAAERRSLETIEGQAELANAEKALQQLSAERRSWYAVMSALGAVGVDGVYLTEFDAQEDGAIFCGGRATDHEHLVVYLERLGDEVKALREKPLLQESSADERGELRFKIRLQF